MQLGLFALDALAVIEEIRPLALPALRVLFAFTLSQKQILLQTCQFLHRLLIPGFGGSSIIFRRWFNRFGPFFMFHHQFISPVFADVSSSVVSAMRSLIKVDKKRTVEIARP